MKSARIKIPYKRLVNFVQLAAPKFVKKFVRFFKENWRIQILRTLSDSLLIGPIFLRKNLRILVQLAGQNSEDFSQGILIKILFEKILRNFQKMIIRSKFRGIF